MLVITGTQRAGTTLMATLLHESGYDLGAAWTDEVGGFEWPAASWFFRNYLGDPTFPFDDFPWPDDSQFWSSGFTEPLAPHQKGQLVCKFSYLLMNPVFVYIWHKYRPDDQLLLMRRPYDAIVASKERMSERFSHDSPLLWQDENALGVNVRASVKAVRLLYPNAARTLLFPEEMDLWIINNELARLNPEVQIKQEVWDRVFDPSKIHFR